MRKLIPPRGSYGEDKKEKVYTSADHRAWHIIGAQQMTAISVKIIEQPLIHSHAMLLLIYQIYESKPKF